MSFYARLNFKGDAKAAVINKNDVPKAAAATVSAKINTAATDPWLAISSEVARVCAEVRKPEARSSFCRANAALNAIESVVRRIDDNLINADTAGIIDMILLSISSSLKLAVENDLHTSTSSTKAPRLQFLSKAFPLAALIRSLLALAHHRQLPSDRPDPGIHGYLRQICQMWNKAILQRRAQFGQIRNFKVKRDGLLHFFFWLPPEPGGVTLDFKNTNFSGVSGSEVFELNLTSQRVCHATSVSAAIAILQSRMIRGRFSDDAYVGFPLVWFGHEVAEEERRSVKKECPKAFKYLSQNRYGSVVFTLPIASILPSQAHFHRLGMRKYQHEHALAVLVSRGENNDYAVVHKEFQSLETADCVEAPETTRPNKVHFPWKSSYSTQGHWIHPEWAFTFDVSFHIEDLRLSFVDHSMEDSCVPRLRRGECDDCSKGRETRFVVIKCFVQDALKAKLDVVSLKGCFESRDWEEIETEMKLWQAKSHFGSSGSVETSRGTRQEVAAVK